MKTLTQISKRFSEPSLRSNGEYFKKSLGAEESGGLVDGEPSLGRYVDHQHPLSTGFKNTDRVMIMQARVSLGRKL